MNTKSIVLLGGAAVAAVVLAAVSLRQRDSNVVAETTAGTKKEQDRLFPDLLAKVNDVTSVTVTRADGSYTLTRTESGWGLADKDLYPIEIEPLRKTLITLGEMKKLEKKTSDPKNHATFGVEEPDAPDSKSTLVTVNGPGGATYARLIVGLEHESKGAMLSNQRYVRVAGDPQTWLVQGSFDLKPKGTDWLAKEILKVARDRVRSVEVTQPDGELLAVDRASPTLTDFTLIDVPEGKELTYPSAANTVAGGLEYVNLEDVEPIAKVDFANGAGPTARYKTFDGLVVTATTKEQDGKSWARFEASYEAQPAPPAPAEGAPPAPAQKSADDVRKEVDELNARLSKWAFQISSYSRSNLGKKKSELLKDKAPPPAPADPNAPPADDKTMFVPNTLPPEIQEQIKAHQESIGNKVVIGTPGETPKPAPDATGTPTPPPTPAPAPHEGDGHDHPHDE